MRFTKITEADSDHDKLEQMSVEQLSLIINEEDQTVANAVKKILPQINSFINATNSSLTNIQIEKVLKKKIEYLSVNDEPEDGIIRIMR